MSSVLPFLCLTILPGLAAAACTEVSGEHRVPVLELYTSEGCDSCPPADGWVSKLSSRGLGPDRMVVLGFHVDYWDKLGWRDPFAQRVFSDRQRAANARNGARFVYTPQLLLDGKDYRPGFGRDDIADRIAAMNRHKAGAAITLRLEPSAGGHLTAEGTITVVETSRRAQAYLALYEDRLSSQVTAGENRGKRLNHDFVVRALVGPYAGESGHKLQFRHVFSLTPNWKASDLSVAAVVQEPGTGAVLQALAMRVCK